MYINFDDFSKLSILCAFMCHREAPQLVAVLKEMNEWLDAVPIKVQAVTANVAKLSSSINL